MLAVLGLILLALLALPSPVAANSTTCSFAAATVTVDVTASDDFAPSILRTGAGDILVADSDGSVDCGAATVNNTDTIVINKANTIANLDITYINIRTPFTGGLTNEPGNSDEIEFVANFPAGGNLSIDSRVSTSDTGVPVDIALGGNEINLNANEADGIDADLIVNGAVLLTVVPATFDDRVIGSGGVGTPATPFTNGMEVCGGLLGGNDTFVGGSANDHLCGLDGNDFIDGAGGDDRLQGDLSVVPAAVGDDVLIGGAGNDNVDGDAGDDQIDNGPGKDSARGGDGNDSIRAGAGRDYGSGAAGNDVIVGDGGRDLLFGGDGEDRLSGKKGRDRIKGEAGNDRHSGGPGRDNCLGGPGADLFFSCELQSP